MQEYDQLRLDKQICFPLYACSKEIIKKYKILLDEYNLTYTQYIVMMVMWDKEEVNLKELGEYLYLDSGTLTPVLKKLENKGYITRKRAKEDERNLKIKITKKGNNLKEQLSNIPEKVGKCVNLNKEETITLYKLTYKILEKIRKE